MMKRLGLLFLFLVSASCSQAAEIAVVVANCGTAPFTLNDTDRNPLYVNTDGQLCADSTVTLAAGVEIIGSVKIKDESGNGLNYTPPDDATAASVNDAATSATCLATNANRQGARFFNDSTVYAYLLEDEGTASATNFTVRMDPGGLYILPMNTSGIYTDDVKCIWASDASGAMRVTEITP